MENSNDFNMAEEILNEQTTGTLVLNTDTDTNTEDTIEIKEPIETEDGKIELPGKKSKKTKEPAKPKAPKTAEPKPFVGFKSDVFTKLAWNDLQNIAKGMDLLSSNTDIAGSLSDAKIKVTTYKNTVRITFDSVRPLELNNTVPDFDKQMENYQWFVDAKNSRFQYSFSEPVSK